MLYRKIEADFFDAVEADNKEVWQVAPMTWRERFQQAWHVFAYPSRRMVLILSKRGDIDRLADLP